MTPLHQCLQGSYSYWPQRVLHVCSRHISCGREERLSDFFFHPTDMHWSKLGLSCKWIQCPDTHAPLLLAWVEISTLLSILSTDHVVSSGVQSRQPPGIGCTVKNKQQLNSVLAKYLGIIGQYFFWGGDADFVCTSKFLEFTHHQPGLKESATSYTKDTLLFSKVAWLFHKLF